ncbi:MAG: 23S rRNA (guanosine(2251)-2'-O)-methyltransferase RlmB [Candidatus Riflebacteria bacterium]|nr:23S rRNA (guanosine(2251)-2'-O)-methyltransferase RlmB [Candidatus Riflebacteria bacterium]
MEMNRQKSDTVKKTEPRSSESKNPAKQGKFSGHEKPSNREKLPDHEKPVDHEKPTNRDKTSDYKKPYGHGKPSAYAKPFKQVASKTEGQIWVRGRHEVFHALKSDQKISCVYLAENASGGLIDDIRTLAAQKNSKLEFLPSTALDGKCGGKCQGCACLIREFTYSDLSSFLEKESGNEKSVICALNCVEDPRNLGAIIRTAEAAGIKGIVIPERRSAEVTEWAVSTSQGAAFYLPVVQVKNLSDALLKMKEAGYQVTGLCEKSEKRYDQVEYPSKVVLVAGGENAGLGEKIRGICDQTISIPMLGKTPSLNVSVSVAVALYEIQRKSNFG